MIDDRWNQDDFENHVEEVLIGCYETKFRKNRGAYPADRIDAKKFERVRKVGPYVPGPSRIYDNTKISGWSVIDMKNDGIPSVGVFACKPPEHLVSSGVYMRILAFKKVERLPSHWERYSGGQLVEILDLFAANEGVTGERFFVSVPASGEVVACSPVIQEYSRSSSFGAPSKRILRDENDRKHQSMLASVAMQYVADRRFCWTITAIEDAAKVCIGCGVDEVKSLLYARDLPLTATGRKRPVLHLVESHRRRIKAGVDVDISRFIRGSMSLEMNGTSFVVRPPDAIIPALSKPSQNRLLEAAQ